MNKKLFGICMMMLLIVTVVFPIVNSSNVTNNSNLGEVKDQYSEWCDDCRYFSGDEWQEFIPTMVKLTRIEVKIAQWFGGSPNIKLTIEKPLGTVLSSKELPVSAIPSPDCDWVSFDIPDINLVPGDNYFIKLNAPLGSEYGWCYSANGLYPNGTSSIWPADWCFRTFCLQNNIPNKPSGAYNKANDEIMITATDPDGDKLRYGVSWDNDNVVDQWTILVSSGTQQSISCVGRKGTVGLITEDEYGAQSGWVSLKSKSKSNIPFGFIFVFGFDVDVKIVQLQPGEDYVDLEVLNKSFYIWENEIETRNPGEFIRLYNAKGLFSPSLPFCFGICDDWGIIG